MADDALAAVYSFVERAYVRMQAAEALTQCLEEGRLSPLQMLVEGLVVAGPPSLAALREVIAEVGSRKGQIKEDQHQVFVKLADELKGYGIHLGEKHSPFSLERMTPGAFLALLVSQKVHDEGDQIACLQRLQEALHLLGSLSGHLRLLDEVEVYLGDWLWGLIYESTRRNGGEAGGDAPSAQVMRML
ncbi:MAG: hypothetical protein L0Z70_06290 [Chloroflexi bacterium]|nr:hypothetical protein [Chloroflexota bacterium]